MVSILQLVILIIPGVAFRVLILFAWCPRQGQRGGDGEEGWGGASEEAGFLQRRALLLSLARRPCARLAGLPCLSSPTQELWAPVPQVHLVNEYLPSGKRNSCGKMITRRIRMKKNSSSEEGSVSDLTCHPVPLRLSSSYFLEGRNPFFLNVVFEKTALFSEQFGHIFFFFKPPGWENSLHEKKGRPLTTHSSW